MHSRTKYQHFSAPPRRRVSVVKIVFVFLAVAGFAYAATPGFYLELDPPEATVGTPVTVRLRVDDPTFDPNRIEWVDFEVDPERWHCDSAWQRDWNAVTDGKPGPWRTELRPFEVGALSIPATTVRYKDASGEPVEMQLTTATLTVKSVRAQGAAAPPDLTLRGPVEIPRNWWPLWIGLAAAVVVASIAWFVARYLLRRQRKTEAPLQPAAPQLPAGVWALRELERRRALPVCRTGPPKAVFSLVSELIRLYLDRRYGIAAIDLTTTECLRELQRIRPGESVVERVRVFLDECDLVKFTKYAPPNERWATIWEDARQLIFQTTPSHEFGGPEPEDQVERQPVEAAP